MPKEVNTVTFSYVNCMDQNYDKHADLLGLSHPSGAMIDQHGAVLK